MGLNYETASAKYLEFRNEVERIEKEAKAKTAALRAVMADIESWFAAKAQEEGLKTIPTAHGTAYWSTHYSAKAANPTLFKDFVIANKMFDLLETRASKVAVKSFIEANGAPPPGVDFTSVNVFNLRSTTKE
jgi:hypothetical protein